MGPLTILEHVRKLAYRLKIPPIWKTYPVISVAHLEPATNPVDDSYQRPRLVHSGPMEPKDNVEPTRDYYVEPTRDHYVVEKLLGRKTSQGQT